MRLGAQAVGRAAWAAVLAVVLSGCTGPGVGTGASGSPTAASEAPGADTGTFRAVVLTTEFLPIAKAQVELSGTDRRAVTTDEGVAVFNDLEPGTYTLVAAKAGYQAKEPKGKLVAVGAGDVIEVKLLMEPTLVLSAENTYDFTFPFTGFITCTVQAYPIAAQSCGRQTVVSDPSGSSNHVWRADSAFAQTVIMEVKWDNSVGALPAQLIFTAYRTKTCSATACTYNDPMFSAKGSSPIYGVVREDETKNLTKRLSPSKVYPKELYADALVYCPTGSCTASVVLQQRYDAWITVFYGEQAPEGWSILKQP